MENWREVILYDEITAELFGAPDPSFFDRYIKDQVLQVIRQNAFFLVLQDPTDMAGEFEIPRSFAYNYQPKLIAV